MRFILLLKSTTTTESGIPPTTAQIQAMMSFYSAMNDAGVVIAAEGLHASGSAGVRVVFHSSEGSAGRKTEPKIIPGPFTPTESLVAGYWIIKVKDLAEALEWAKKCPLEEEGATIEVRRIVEMDDEQFEGSVTEEIRELAGRMRRETEERSGGN